MAAGIWAPGQRIGAEADAARHRLTRVSDALCGVRHLLGLRLRSNIAQPCCACGNPPANKKGREDPMSNIRVLATGLEFPEGPVVLPDGSVVLVEIRGQRLTRVWPDGRKEVVAKIPGGPNGAAMGPDGKCYICNNGGFCLVSPRRPLISGGPG